ncbi:MAG: bifunctional UDP-N-acetylglucosamine diphosphorylase/glucosamine-phosphate N-acetyltransferase [Pseudomonadota bacterium]|jgi:bifunctional UDP-N-acetylglucosamine pyrophosphorylase/glucosamine-1-phosphate N-acetyltransferase
MNLFFIILAAGQGTRMRSTLPKVLHPIAGKPMLQHVIDACEQVAMSRVAIVYGHGGEQVKQQVSGNDLLWALQAEQKGTGHAVNQAIDLADDTDMVLVATGDVPLIRPETLKALADGLAQATLCVLTTKVPNPKGYGRIVRDAQAKLKAIIEEKDASEEQRKITEINTGFMVARAADWKRWLKQLTPQNAQGEYYLTDCIGLAVAEGWLVNTVHCEDSQEVEGVNNRVQLAQLERVAQKRQIEQLMLSGVTVVDPLRLDIRGKVTAQIDTFIDVNVVLQGKVVLGQNVVIEPNCIIKDSTIGDFCHIKANSIIESATIARDCDIGPFARIRPDTVLEAEAKIGNFVETKKAHIGFGSKVSHLSYIGDAEIGANVNVGAGTITCNYDGVNKHKTVIGDGAFIGSCSQLVAPVTVGEGATIGAGSTITKDAPPQKLTLTRAPQKTIENWKRPVKEQK